MMWVLVKLMRWISIVLVLATDYWEVEVAIVLFSYLFVQGGVQVCWCIGSETYTQGVKTGVSSRGHGVAEETAVIKWRVLEGCC